MLDLLDVAFVRDTQAENLTVEVEQRDGLKPARKLLLGGLLSDLRKAVLPYIAICLCVCEHFCDTTKVVIKLCKKKCANSCFLTFLSYG